MVLANLGVPFGSPSRIINIPAAAGSQYAGQMQMQGWVNLGQALGAYFAQRGRTKREKQDVANLLAHSQAMQQYPQQLAGYMPQAAQAGQQWLEPGMGDGQMFPQVPQEPQLPMMESERFRDMQGEMALKQALPPPQAKTTQASSVIIDPNNPDRAIRVRDTFNQEGNLINRQVLGEATLAEKLGGVAPEVFTQLQKPVASKIQMELKDAIIDIANLEDIESSFRDEFAQIPFKIGQRITKLKDLFGLPVTEEERKNLTAFSSWRRNAQREFVVFKKWATGVAAGQKEMTEQIETAFPSGLKDSAIEFRSKIRSAIKVRKRTQQILVDILNSGTVLSLKQKRDVEQRALRQALREYTQRGREQVMPEETGTVQPSQRQQQFTPAQIEAELRRRGAIQ